MNRLHLIILLSLQKTKATSVPAAITLSEIKNTCGITQSITTLSRAMKYLHENEYVSKGLKTINSHTFYLNENGTKLLLEVM
jgi:CTP-dependent riboflavin kinase